MRSQIYLSDQLRKHPSMQPQDIVKLCYQSAHGAEHLLSDIEGAKSYLQKEFESVTAADDEICEAISDKVCRINLSAWKAAGLPTEWLFGIFAASCKIAPDGDAQMSEYLRAADNFIRTADTAFTVKEWEDYLSEYQKSGMNAVHHSEKYRKAEQPAYRIADIRFSRILPILKEINERKKSIGTTVIAIDGRAASGKTTLASDLSAVIEADTVHMDDFFVPPALRSEERFRTPGENIHHERFRTEVLPYLSERKPFAYRIFDCSIMDYSGNREIGDKPFRLVEGSYSTHPKFGSYADVTVFSDLSADEQTERIRKRNGEEMLEMFQNRWIPMEEDYFAFYKIKDNADITV